MLDCDCPRCGSRNTKALSVLHQNGTRDSRYRKDGLFYYRRCVGLHTSSIRGRSQTVSAQMAAPPSGNAFFTGACIPVSLVIGALVGGSTGFLLVLGVLILLAIVVGSGDDGKMKDWRSTFRCGRCGTVFVVIEDHEPSPIDTQREVGPGT